MKRLTGGTNATLALSARLYYRRGWRPESMQFLKTLFWVLIAVIIALFASRNWVPVAINLWGDIEADVKIPILLLIAFLIGFVPTWLTMRARLWALERRLEAMERNRATALTVDEVNEVNEVNDGPVELVN